MMKKRKELNNKSIESNSLHHFVQSLLVPSVRQSHKATCPDEVSAELFKAGGETVLDIMHMSICVAIWKLVSDHRNGRFP